MAEVKFFATPGYGETQIKNLHYNQAVKIGNRVEISGQGGWDDEFNFPDDLDEEIVRAFDNVERTLATAGASWRDVISVTSYHVLSEKGTFDAHNRVITDQFRTRMGDRAPIWTEVGVTVLGAPKMHIEIVVTAVIEN